MVQVSEHGTNSCYTNDKCRCDECRAAGAANGARWRAENPEKEVERNARYYRAHKDEMAARQRHYFSWMRTIKAAQGCRDCGTHEGRLTHHHLDPSTKRYAVSGMANHSLEAIFDEIAKCTVLCHSCHMSLHRRTVVEVG